MACVNVPALPLQLLLNQHPDWHPHPVAVVDQDTPQGVIQWVNRPARRCRILPGMRYAAGLSLARELRADTVPDELLQHTVRQIAHHLWCFSPDLEPCTEEPGLFWLDLSGLLHLYASPTAWADAVHADVRTLGLHAVVIVGHTRFATYAAARSSRRNLVFDNTEDEQRYLQQIPIDLIGLPARARDTLVKLGVKNFGQFLSFPPDGIRKRFGAEAAHMYRQARIRGWSPLNPEPMREPPSRILFFEFPEINLTRVFPRLTHILQSILCELSQQGELLTQLRALLLFEDHEPQREKIQPATPTLDLGQLSVLLRLRLEALQILSGITELHLQGIGTPATHRQVDLFCQVPRRDGGAIHQAFARLRAQYGNDIVSVAHLQDAHLPEACFHWQSIQQLPVPQPNTDDPPRSLVRRIYTRPKRLPLRGRHEPDGWLVAGPGDGPVQEVVGPHKVSGGWWVRETSRDYHYVRTENGRWLWTYFDEKRRRWFLQGEVE